MPKNLILLDNQSKVNVFSNKDQLKNDKKTNQHMTIMYNAGTTLTNMIGELAGYPGEVWYIPNSIPKTCWTRTSRSTIG